MLPRSQVLSTVIALFMGLSAHAECTPPKDVSIPQGADATEEEMTTGQQYVRDFMKANQTYRDCLDEELAELGEEATPEQKASSTQLYNLSVDREQAIVDQFNSQIREFNKANP